VRSLGAVTVVAPAMGGLVIGQEVARQLGVHLCGEGEWRTGSAPRL
jgi:adenine/guanine phosphoribosyltransferase-like PRPP-binding protein